MFLSEINVNVNYKKNVSCKTYPNNLFVLFPTLKNICIFYNTVDSKMDKITLQ